MPSPSFPCLQSCHYPTNPWHDLLHSNVKQRSWSFYFNCIFGKLFSTTLLCTAHLITIFAINLVHHITHIFHFAFLFLCLGLYIIVNNVWGRAPNLQRVATTLGLRRKKTNFKNFKKNICHCITDSFYFILWELKWYLNQICIIWTSDASMKIRLLKHSGLWTDSFYWT